MADKRTYTITINGLQESFDGVTRLREALDTLTDTVVNVTKEEEKTAATRKETKTATDQLTKAKEKATNWDKEYQTELAKVNKELSDNKKEIKDAIKLQEAEKTIQGEVGQTYREKQQYLTALNTVIRNNTEATREDYQALIQQSAALQADLKAQDEQMKIYVRNVGNYPGAVKEVVESHKSLKQELKDLKAQMSEMLASGVSKTDAAYLKLAERAGHLKDAMKDANEDITNFASDTRGLTNAINLATSAVNAYQLYNSALQLFGDENEKAAESMQKMMSIMTLLNSLQQVQNSLLDNGSATARLYTKSLNLIKSALGLKKKAVEDDKKATEDSTKANNQNQVSEQKDAAAKKMNATASKSEKTATQESTLSTQKDTVEKNLNEKTTNKMTVAKKAATVATKTLSVALRAIPLMLVIGLITELVTHWEDLWNWLRKTVPWIDKVGKKFDEMGGFVNTAKAYLITLVDYIKNVVMNTLDGLWNILKDIFTLDWGKIGQDWQTMGEKNGKAWGNAVQKGANSAQEAITKKQTEEQLKRLKNQKDYLDVTESNYKTHSKKYRKLVDDIYKAERYLAKDNAEKLHEIDVQYYKDKTDLRNQDTKAAEEAAKKNKQAAEKAEKELKEYRSKIDKLIDDSEKAYQDVYQNIIRESAETNAAVSLDTLKIGQEKIAKDFIESGKTISKEMFDSLLLDGERYMSKRKAIVAQSLAVEAQDAKLRMQKIIEEAKEQRDKLDEQLKSAKKKDPKYKNDEQEAQLLSLNKVISQTQNALDTLFGKYNEKSINLPVNIDVDGIYDRYAAIYSGAEEMIKLLTKRIDEETDENKKKILQNKIDIAKAEQDMMKLWKPEAIVDGFLGVKDAFKNVFDNVKKYYSELDEETQKTTDLNTLLVQVFGQMGETAGFSTKHLREMRGALVDMLASGDEDKAVSTLQDMFAKVQSLRAEIEANKDQWKNNADALQEYIDGFSLLDDSMKISAVQMKDFGDLTYEQMKKLGEVGKEWSETTKKIAEESIKKADETIKQVERVIKNFQDMSKDIKFEPVTDNSKFFKTQLIKVEETRKKYAELRNAYKTYLDSITEGSKEMQEYEKAWQSKLENTKFIYGEESKEYKQMQYEKEQADAAYVAARKKTQEQLDELNRKDNQLPKDGLDALGERMREIYDIINDNLMQPIADGLGSLFDFELEELQEALDEIEEMLTKATDLRQQSADRVKQINDEIKNSDNANKENLKQQLADEQVLLVQREQTERALQKEKEKKEREIKRNEAKQRILELTQKLGEGIVNTAVGVTAALKYGPILGPIFAAIIGAMGAVQTGIIIKQIDKAKAQMQMEHGGKIGEQGISRSHKQGGHRVEGTNIEVEGGEWVVNKKSSKKYDGLIHAINADNPAEVFRQANMHRGDSHTVYVTNHYQTTTRELRRFAAGGRLDYMTAAEAVTSSKDRQLEKLTRVVESMDMQPVVSVTDINRKQSELVKVQQLAGK